MAKAKAETELAHRSGLGPWLANWGVQSLGGMLDFADDVETGPRVCVTVPRLRGDETDAVAD